MSNRYSSLDEDSLALFPSESDSMEVRDFPSLTASDRPCATTARAPVGGRATAAVDVLSEGVDLLEPGGRMFAVQHPLPGPSVSACRVVLSFLGCALTGAAIKWAAGTGIWRPVVNPQPKVVESPCDGIPLRARPAQNVEAEPPARPSQIAAARTARP